MKKKILYIDLDNTLVDFPSGIAALSDEYRKMYLDRYKNAPGIFALMKPVPGAVEAFSELAEEFDTYILSTAPWNNPSAWQHKLEWVYKHLGKASGTPAYKRLILSHHKHLNRGDFLVDDRPNNGASKFEGEWIKFGPLQYSEHPDVKECLDWAAATEYLLERK